MGRPTRSAFGGRHIVDMAQSLGTSSYPKGSMTSEAYQLMKAEKRRKAAEKRSQNSHRRNSKKKPG